MIGEKMARILNRKQVAKWLQADLRTIDYLVRTNQIPYSRIGKRLIRFEEERLMQWLHDREGVKFLNPRSK